MCLTLTRKETEDDFSINEALSYCNVIHQATMLFIGFSCILCK